MRKILFFVILLILVGIGSYISFVYFAVHSEGVRSGELIKFSRKGYVFKTWEGEISQGISGAQIFSFSVGDGDKNIIYDLQEFQGNYVKVYYIERYKTFFWLGETNYYVTKVIKEESPHSNILNRGSVHKKQVGDE